MRRLQRYGVQFFQLGEFIKLVIPASLLFPHNSPRLVSTAFPILNETAFFLRQHPKIDVKISAYTDDVDLKRRNLALTQTQASSVANYLWKLGIDSRLNVAIGYGSAHPIATNKTTQGRKQNRRVEITLRHLTV